MSAATPPPDAKCPSCEAGITGRYCQRCGEKRLSSEDFSVSRIFGDALSAIINLDSKLWLSLRTLILKPGVLTKDYIAGRRKPYLGPFQLFLIASILFYIVIGRADVFMVPSQWFFGGGNSGPIDIPSLVTQKAASKELSEAEVALLYDSKISGYSKLFLILAIPFLALTTFAMQRRKTPELGKHVIFATHIFTFVLFWLLVWLVTSFVIVSVIPKPLMFVVAAIVMMTYFTVAVRNVWNEPAWKAGLKGFVIFVVLITFMITYRTIISYLTLRFL